MTVYELWLPILVAGIGVHVASFLAWVVLPHHKPEWGHLPLDDSLDGALKSLGATAGSQYVLHDADANPEKDPTVCRGTLVLWDFQPSMGRNILITLIYFLFISFLIGYLASFALGAEASSLDRFRFTSIVAMMVYSLGGMPHVVWFRRRVLMDMIDGAAYAMITGLAFAMLWPK